jgi:succinate dehydrogenase / fumarate reductase cytochrome b subunit
MNNRRPKYLNVFQIRLPVPALVSILHRISGLLLFLALPLFLWMLQCSRASSDGYAQLASLLAHPVSKLGLLLLLWALLHHLCAGLRFLAIDLDIGVLLAPARAGAKAVLGVSLVLTALFGARLW